MLEIGILTFWQVSGVVAAASLGTAVAVLLLLSRSLPRPPDFDAPGPVTDTITLPARDFGEMQRQLDGLRRATEGAPVLIWCQRKDGTIHWANSAYRDMLATAGLTRPAPDGGLPSLFGPLAPGQAPAEGTSRRMSVDQHGDPRKWWFDWQVQQLDGGEVLNYAAHANPVVRAEEAFRNFVQTLTLTFAHLPTGLAVFDRKRQLGLFNPALSDLTRIEPEWLSARPTLYAFLDRLRDKRMMPEPKDYKNWRQRMSELEQAAADGTYEETWPLPGGQTVGLIPKARWPS
ncbi:hypothetical protein DDZ14_04540 [Maritimibacter sp. 55A14]|uniref:PAS domain-containing protein n=1 Tax=Maritimibacter sp. 55A14 TaxID=2174844 RepID=UPI000D61C67B|nr:PAS domain-containing protein [Maritimibacter sp. 55A14]PWE33471.1 hypothetical protein DDZ14_04540 [Maritimibacter sp. 55A14]